MKPSNCPKCNEQNLIPDYAIGVNVKCKKCANSYLGKWNVTEFINSNDFLLEILHNNQAIGSFTVGQIIQYINNNEFTNDFDFSFAGLKQPLSLEYLDIGGLKDTKSETSNPPTSNIQTPRGGIRMPSESLPPDEEGCSKEGKSESKDETILIHNPMVEIKSNYFYLIIGVFILLVGVLVTLGPFITGGYIILYFILGPFFLWFGCGVVMQTHSCSDCRANLKTPNIKRCPSCGVPLRR